jgi:ribonuclease VapC
MIVDASALLAGLFEEPGFDTLAAAPGTAEPRRMSVVRFREAAVEMDGVAGSTDDRVDRPLAADDVEVIAVTPDHARDAHARFGEGRHPARPNMGDRFAYALAAEPGETPPFKGDDFARTDVRPAP